MFKHKTNKAKGITLIALVVTIIVLLLLAGISIMMLTGDNGILQQATDARTKTIHANVFEQLQLEELSHLTNKTISRDTSTLIGYLQSKSIIGDEIGEDTGKYQVNVTALLGSKQSLGNGDATVELKDVYMLEKQTTSTGSIVNTKVATTTPIKIAATTTNQVIYKVVYYGNNTSSVANLGNLSDTITISNPSGPTGDPTDYSTALYEHYKDMNYEQVEGANTIDGTDATWLFYGNEDDFYPDYIEYKGGVYKVSYINDEPYNVSSVEKVSSNANFTKWGVYTIDGTNVLITPNAEDGLIVHSPLNLSNLSAIFGNLYYLKENGTDIDLTRIVTGNVYEVDGKIYNESGELINVIYAEGPLMDNDNWYYLKENGTDIDLTRTVTGNIYKANGKYYNESGELINVICAEGPKTFYGYHYLKDNGDLDWDRPFTEGYYSNDTNSYYDTYGVLVHVNVTKM